MDVGVCEVAVGTLDDGAVLGVGLDGTVVSLDGSDVSLVSLGVADSPGEVGSDGVADPGVVSTADVSVGAGGVIVTSGTPVAARPAPPWHSDPGSRP